MNLQYQLSNGRWMSCENRSYEFLQKCIKYNEKLSESDICQSLKNGAILKHGSDWEDNVRCEDFAFAESEKLQKKIENSIRTLEEEEDFDARDDER